MIHHKTDTEILNLAHDGQNIVLAVKDNEYNILPVNWRMFDFYNFKQIKTNRTFIHSKYPDGLMTVGPFCFYKGKIRYELTTNRLPEECASKFSLSDNYSLIRGGSKLIKLNCEPTIPIFAKWHKLINFETINKLKHNEVIIMKESGYSQVFCFDFDLHFVTLSPNELTFAVAGKHDLTIMDIDL